MNEQAAAFAAVTAIEEGSWDRYLLRIQAAIRQRMATEAYKRHIIVGQEPGSEGTPASMQREGTNPICRYPLHTGSHGSECFTRPAGAEGRAT